MTPPLIELRHCDVFLNQHHILRDVSWQLQHGEHWAFWGANGSGKSTLLQLIRGEIWPHFARGSRLYHFEGVETSSPLRAREHIAFVSGAQHEKYRRQEWNLSGLDIVLSGYFHSELLHQKPTHEQREHAEQLAQELGLSALLERDHNTLSHGELRRFLIARALVVRPQVLVLDEACSGLDSDARTQMLQFIESLTERDVQLLLATHRREEVVPSISHVAHLQKGHIIAQGRRDDILPPQKPPIEYSKTHTTRTTQGTRRFQTLVNIKNANVFRDGNHVLHDVSWTWASGQHWRVRGANGSVKSTFLKLIAGELWPALGGTIARFDNTKFSDIWQMKHHVGVVSPELQERYTDDATGFEVVASGFSSSIGVAPALIGSQRARIEQTLQRCGISHLGDRPITQMSSGEALKTLLARALINNPDILLLDEPFDSLDEYSMRDFKHLLSDAIVNGAHILLVSHHDEDSVPFLTHEMTFESGRILAQKCF